MKRILRLSLRAIIAFFTGITSLKAQNPTMDAQWTIISNNGSQLVLELGIRTNTSGEHLGPAQFIFLFDHTYVKFNGGSTGAGSSGTDYNWQGDFNPTVYTGTNTGVTQPTVGKINIDLDYTSGTGAAISSTTTYTPVIDLVFAVSNPAQSTTITWAMNEGSPPTMDDVTDDNISSPTNFDQGSFGGITLNPLPVTLLNFSAHLKNSKTILSWTTASEINNNYFTLERSIDGEHFDLLKQIKGSGTSEIKNYYNADDETPLPGVSYYRLSQTDFNGASQIFPMVSINNSDAISKNLLITTASFDKGIGNIYYVVPDDGPIILRVTDINGKLIHKEQVGGQKGFNKHIFPASLSLKPGLYFILLNFKGQSVSAKMMKT